MLVDLDLLKELIYKVLVERVGFTFFMEVEYERLPKFFTFCSCIGHALDNFKRRNVQDQGKEKVKTKVDLKKMYVEKQKE